MKAKSSRKKPADNAEEMNNQALSMCIMNISEKQVSVIKNTARLRVEINKETLIELLQEAADEYISRYITEDTKEASAIHAALGAETEDLDIRNIVVIGEAEHEDGEKLIEIAFDLNYFKNKSARD